MKIQLFKSHLLLLVTFCSMTLTLASCSNEEVVQDGTGSESENDKNLTTFIAGDEPTTRTSMDYNTGAFYWEADDYIYVKDDDGNWQKSSNAPTTKVASFKYKVPGKFTQKASYKVYYPGKNGINDEVTIPAAQSQSQPNTTDHFGVSGDCGTADAVGSVGGGSFSFRLDHQAAILVFQPYVSNTKLVDGYVTKIEVTSDNDITDTYKLNPITGELTGTGSGKQITLTTMGSGTYTNGFPLNTMSANMSVNGAYMFIKPGRHTLKVCYWIKDIATNVEGFITKTLCAFNYNKNTYYDMKADLKVTDYSGSNYYMWDAKMHYWDGFDWTYNYPANVGQPVLNGTNTSSNYPKSNSDPRWYNEYSPNTYVKYDASQAHFKPLPNANEMVWYCINGDPHWDADRLWTTMGHLYKGGMWFLKKSKISGFSTERAPDNMTDLRIAWKDFSNNAPKQSLPNASVADDYFYLPALGYYTTGELFKVGFVGYYWSSSGFPCVTGAERLAVSLGFDKEVIRVSNSNRHRGFKVQTFY